jgi:hypothetical protein
MFVEDGGWIPLCRELAGRKADEINILRINKYCIPSVEDTYRIGICVRLS